MTGPPQRRPGRNATGPASRAGVGRQEAVGDV